jgi:CspA family cold shock protein
MGSKGRGYREPRRRGFDDDDMFTSHQPRGDSRGGGGGNRGGFDRPFGGPAPAPRMMAPSDGPSLDATVKWFNGEKGFGFVELADGSGDAFLHIGALQAAGRDAVEPGTTMKVQIGQGQKGRQVTAVVEVTGMTAVPARPPRPRTERPAMNRSRTDPSTAQEITGTVKWFNPEKGFGFVVAEDGGKDVFVHISVLERAGIRELADGTRVQMTVEQGQKGREATSITPLS